MAIEPRNGIDGKVCSCCSIWKPLTDYYKDRSKGRSQGFTHCRCKKCYKAGRRLVKIEKEHTFQRALGTLGEYRVYVVKHLQNNAKKFCAGSPVTLKACSCQDALWQALKRAIQE